MTCFTSNGNLVTCYVADQCGTYGRFVRDFELLGIGLGRSNDGVEQFLIELLIVKLYGAADGDGALNDVHIVDDLCVFEHCLEFNDTSLKLGLLVLCLIILGVFGKVTEATCDLDLFGDLVTGDRFEVLKLVLQSLKTL